ncbi:hypothetical protein Poly51_06330 [Rubripirellula tenax]|uniref:Uncharacterized protein n=1 Tax=Rubripirellula tenax TaxID=2528015 RepID=A0A5C6FG00_9BACT|nr:hypothetical protein Poly51_06330 [Rubripirellula tenax]
MFSQMESRLSVPGDGGRYPNDMPRYMALNLP